MGQTAGRGRMAALAAALLLVGTGATLAQTPAKELFGAKTRPSDGAPAAIGFYSHGCLQGAMQMPADGPTWQVMKPSRNRAFAHPAMISLLQRISRDAARQANWRGLLFGDMAQPRGGPMRDGHASHQIGLDADIYLTEMPNRRLSNAERDSMPLPSLIDPKTTHLNERRWRPEIAALIKTAANEPEVERLFVHPGIKEKLCKVAGRDRAWLNKVRPMFGHDYHFHVRMKCLPGSKTCEPQESTGKGDGCDKLDWWFDVALKPPPPNAKPYKKPPPLFMTALPKACAAVLAEPDAQAPAIASATRAATPPAAAYAAPEPTAVAPAPAPAAPSGGMPMPRFRSGG
ncbi:penicillin-insensitive murein endopeptidase [Aureimonas sp. AU4]|uniref:penicillin-insensitive murein endopeptidase n=1 Tax=Aureimonas sp. AU4 TaxID=1638163 RepID=UPI000785173E|nr:penicillin-insensitive murein endopeptidase [Aureimonas sp. AU4]